MYVADLGGVEIQPALALLAGHVLSALQVLTHPALLLLQNGNLGLQPDVFLSEVVQALLELQGLRVESLLVLVDLLGEDSGEIVGGEVGLHEHDVLLAEVFVGDVVVAGLVGVGPLPTHAHLGGLRSELNAAYLFIQVNI